MKLKKIRLKNIRSYENQEVDFPEGSTLISGDIGSGKTSVLLAIEFAFFGLQPGQRGSSLLRNGADSGLVEMEFEVDGKSITVERTLKRNKTISQDSCSVTIDGEKKQLSVTELKSLILSTLNYPKEFSKKQNTLYKFTVYTPQEEMKQIITEDNETRTNVLRHVFGIDKYKRIIENTSLLTVKMREEMRLKEAIISTMLDEKEVILSKEKELEEKNYNLIFLNTEFFSRTEERKKIQQEIEEVSSKVEERKKIQQEIEKHRIMLSNKKEMLSGNFMKIENLRGQISEMKSAEFDDSMIAKLEDEMRLKKKEKEKINLEFFEVSSRINSLNIKVHDNNSLKGKISGLDICPTCLQEVNSSYKANIFSKLDSEAEEIAKNLLNLGNEKQALSEKAKAAESKIFALEKRMSDLNLLRARLYGIHEKQLQITEIEKNNALIEMEIEMMSLKIGTLEKSVADLEIYDRIFSEKTKLLDESARNEKNVEIKIAELKREIKVFSDQIEEMKNRMKKAEEIKMQLNHIAEVENWLSSKFIPLISFIEKNIMIRLKSEFSSLFSEWFSMLVSDSFNVSLSDDFTPLIEQRDFELDYAYLSGGERTAVALAYRLALNQVINSMMSNIKTKDVIILDEPTEGFSSQQLDKMRDVLNQLNVGQLIIVSHEPKIESYVDNVIKFRKDNGTSVAG